MHMTTGHKWNTQKNVQEYSPLKREEKKRHTRTHVSRDTRKYNESKIQKKHRYFGIKTEKLKVNQRDDIYTIKNHGMIAMTTHQNKTRFDGFFFGQHGVGNLLISYFYHENLPE